MPAFSGSTATGVGEREGRNGKRKGRVMESKGAKGHPDFTGIDVHCYCLLNLLGKLVHLFQICER